MNPIERLKQTLDAAGCRYRCEEPLRLHTSFRIGGPAELFVTPDSPRQTAQLLDACRRFGVPALVMGNGSNLLVPDEGIRGAVVAFGASMSRITRRGNTLIAEAGATLSQLCRFAQQEGLTGLEFAWGIPGSVGGAVRMNAGAYGGEIKDVVTAVDGLTTDGKAFSVSAQEAQFGYRTSRFVAGEIVSSAVFSLFPGSPEAIDARMAEILQKRMEKQPLDYPSAGSAFKRPKGAFAAALIDSCGLKGLTVGGAQVSEKHAGFVINTGGATAHDVLALLRQVQEEVLRQTGILLEPEIQILK